MTSTVVSKIPSARRSAAGITTTAITWCAKSGTITRSNGTAGSTTDSAERLLVQDGTLAGEEQGVWDAAANPLEGSVENITHNRLAQLNDIRWRYNTHACTVEKDNGLTRGTAKNRRRRSASATIRSVAASVKRDARSWADSQPASHHHPVCLGMTAYWGKRTGMCCSPTSTKVVRTTTICWRV